LFVVFKESDIGKCKGAWQSLKWHGKMMANMPLITGQADSEPSELVVLREIVEKAQCLLTVCCLFKKVI
jgi:hypothetical protein